jgi:predicted Zn finger-like uncharacterized protein
MSVLYTRCTHCDTLFELTLDELNAAAGVVRCGVCRETFDAKVKLTEELPAAPDGDGESGADDDESAPPVLLTSPPPAGDGEDGGEPPPDAVSLSPDDANAAREPEGEAAVDDVDGGDEPSRHADPPTSPEGLHEATDEQPDDARGASRAHGHAGDPAGDPADAPPPWADEAFESDPPPVFFDAPEPAPRSAVATVAWGLASVVLLLALAAQSTWHWRNELLQQRQIGPWLVTMNDRLGAPMALEYDPRRYEFVAPPRLVQAGPAAGDGATPDAASDSITLNVLAEIANRAAVPQPAPWLQLVIEDRWGRPVAARTLPPRDYLAGHTDGPWPPMLAPGEHVELDVRVAAQVTQTEAFSMDVCLPRRDGSLYCAGN